MLTKEVPSMVLVLVFAGPRTERKLKTISMNSSTAFLPAGMGLASTLVVFSTSTYYACNFQFVSQLRCTIGHIKRNKKPKSLRNACQIKDNYLYIYDLLLKQELHCFELFG